MNNITTFIIAGGILISMLCLVLYSDSKCIYDKMHKK